MDDATDPIVEKYGADVDILPISISRLVNLSHFCSSKEFHSNIPEVGKMKFLRDLKEFHVKKESVGFELRQLGELTELEELMICNLQTVTTKEEASDARLKNKRNLKQLKLVRVEKHLRTAMDYGDVLEGLEPPSNLRELGIKNYGGAAGPSWLLSDVSMKRLETLHLEGVRWRILPPFEQLPHLTTLKLENIHGMCVFGPGFAGVTETSLMHLKTIEIVDMPQLKEWVGGPNSPLFSRLEKIKCYNCPLLSSFSFLECCTNLRSLYISCPKVVSQLPHTSALTHMFVGARSLSCLEYDGKKIMRVNSYDSALAFQNMDKVEDLTITDSPQVSFSVSDLQKLNSLRRLTVNGLDSNFSAVGKSIAAGSFRLEELEVNSISAVLIAPFCSLLAATLHTLTFRDDMEVETLTKVQEQALRLLASLHCLELGSCKRLQSLPRGLYRLPSLRKLSIRGCDGILSLPPKEDLPLASLQLLDVSECSDELKEQAKKYPCPLVFQVHDN